MAKTYLVKKVPGSIGKAIEWIVMSKEEFRSFLAVPEGKGRTFINMGDIVIECMPT